MKVRLADWLALVVMAPPGGGLALGFGWYAGHGHPSVTRAMGFDWVHSFSPAAEGWGRGESPYGVMGFFNPPWMLLPLAVLSFAPHPWGYGVLAAVNLAGWVWVVMVSGSKFQVWSRYERSTALLDHRRWWRAAMVIPFVIFCGPLLNSFYGNLDGLVALGLCLPPQWGLLVVMVKPQIGLPMAIFWGVEAWRKGGMDELKRTFVPLLKLFWLSMMLYGFWFLKFGAVTDKVWNASVWPWGIPAGLVFLGLALWKRKLGWAVMAGPFLSPYLASHSWAFLGLGIMLIGKDGKDG